MLRAYPPCVLSGGRAPRAGDFYVDVANGLTILTAAKLVIYTFGALIHLFLMVLILGNRRLRRLEWLLFGLMAALFMWYSGNLLALNISLYYGAGPAILSGILVAVSTVGFIAAVPLLVHVHSEYCAGLPPLGVWKRSLVACFYIPVLFSPWIVARLLSHLGWEPLIALGNSLRWLVLWAVAALLFASGINQEMSGIFLGRLNRGLSFGHRRNVVRSVHRITFGEIPGALIHDLSVERFPRGDVLLAVHQGKTAPGTTGMSVRPMISIRREVWSTSSSRQASPVSTVIPSTSVSGELIRDRIACMSVPPGPACLDR